MVIGVFVFNVVFFTKNWVNKIDKQTSEISLDSTGDNINIQSTELEPLAENVSVEKPTKKLNLYSIEAMRMRQYLKSDIKTESVIRETSKYTSYKISFTSDGLKQYAMMSVPKGNVPDGGFPVLIFVHGWIYPPAYSTENSYSSMAEYFSSNGFLVLKPDYRGNGKSEGDVLQGKSLQWVMAQIEYAIDVRTLIESVENIPNANISKLFLFGHSMGGDIGLRVLELYPKIIAASLWAPSVYWYPENQIYFIRKLYPSYLDFFSDQLSQYVKDDEYLHVGALENVSLVNSAVLIHQAENDNVTPYYFGKTLAEELKKANKDVTFYTYEGTSHMLGSGYSRALERDLNFFRSF